MFPVLQRKLRFIWIDRNIKYDPMPLEITKMLNKWDSARDFAVLVLFSDGTW